MAARIRALVSFQSTAFNTTDDREYFLYPGCFGDDLAYWLMQELEARGVLTGGMAYPGDFGWYFSYRVRERDFDFLMGYRPGKDDLPGDWIGWVERRTKFWGTLFGARNIGIPIEAVNVIHTVLSSSPQITHLRWHIQSEFNAGNEANGTEEPEG